jgi:GH15 family glucan-1,4-alpha-glucosidase
MAEVVISMETIVNAIIYNNLCAIANQNNISVNEMLKDACSEAIACLLTRRSPYQTPTENEAYHERYDENSLEIEYNMWRNWNGEDEDE